MDRFDDKYIGVANVFNSVTIAAAASGAVCTALSNVWPIKLWARRGVFSVMLGVQNLMLDANARQSGTIDLIYQLSHDGVNYQTPTTATSIATNFSGQSGAAKTNVVSGGCSYDIISFLTPLAPWIRFYLVNKSATSRVTVDCWMAVA